LLGIFLQFYKHYRIIYIENTESHTMSHPDHCGFYSIAKRIARRPNFDMKIPA